MSDTVELDRLRQRGVQILAIAGWASTLISFVIDFALDGRLTPAVLAISVIANIAPTVMALRGRYDEPARLLAGSLAAIQPAVAVSLLAGHPWQMDGHMYFFVGLAAIAVLCDWKPLALATALIAAHHFAFELLMPAYVFPGNGNIGRVLIHAAAVILQFSVLSYLTVKLRQLLVRQADARRESEQLAADAIARSRETEAALAAARSAEGRESTERHRRQAIEADAAARRREEMLTLASAFHASVADIVAAVGTASTELDGSARSLNDLAKRANRGTSDTALLASQSSDTAQTLAARIADLSYSITAIAASASQQAQLSGSARTMSDSGHQAVSALAERSGAIANFADSISDIAGRTNLLALNAAMEAARVGDAGRGFAVVAQEVKQLAGQASDATGAIRSLAGSVQGGADVANGALHEIATMVGALSEAAQEIRNAVDQQRDTAAAIEATARSTADGASRMAQQIGDVVAVAGDTERLSTRVSGAASVLSRTAQDLQAATERFVAQLKAA
jgi:methyl-accepting chemotaxis protein